MSYWLVIILTAVIALMASVRIRYQYWQQRGVAQLKDQSLWRNIQRITALHNEDLLKEVYSALKGKVKMAGSYLLLRPIAIVLDLDLVQAVLIKDFSKCSDRIESQGHWEKLTQHLFMANSEAWRALRTKLTPTFTSSKMKFMFPTVAEVAQKLCDVFEEELKLSPDHSLDLHEINARFTTDVIGTCVFGVECNSLKDPNVEFRRMGRKVFPTNKHSVLWDMLKFVYMKYLGVFKARRFPIEVEEFFVRIVNETVLERERRNIHRNDFIDLLIELKNKKDANGNPTLTLDSISAQLFVFFAAGFETSSSNISNALCELARNPEEQIKARNEILQVLKKYNGQLTYEAMMEMSYLDQVMTETLRMHPPLAGIQRIAMEDYLFPGTDVLVPKGTIMLIPIKCIHYDPEYYDEPYEFRPARFHPSEILKRHPQSFLGFGDGPRNCIGMRFARMQVKVGLITLLSKYSFSICEKTTYPEELSKHCFVLVPAKGVWLRADKL